MESRTVSSRPSRMKPGSASLSATPPPFTRISGTWVAICAAAAFTVLMIIFLLQNQHSVSVQFLWMQGTFPMAIALLIAATSVAIPGAVIGTARIAQLKRTNRDQH